MRIAVYLCKRFRERSNGVTGYALRMLTGRGYGVVGLYDELTLGGAYKLDYRFFFFFTLRSRFVEGTKLMWEV